MNRVTLVVMAAGMASRYGGDKQIEGMGPNGEILMEYSIRDAIRAGFSRVVFVIKPEMLGRMKELCGDRMEQEIEVRYAFQDFSSLPDFYTIPDGRVKPFGTVHAMLCARPYVDGPFAIINADDYYGVDSFARMYGFLAGLDGAGRAAMVGYRLKNTVSRHGGVTRGLCQLRDGLLTGVREARRVRLMDDGRILEEVDSEQLVPLDPEQLVSMNFWGFPGAIFDEADRGFRDFLRDIPAGDVTAEYLLPVMVDQMIRAGKLEVSVLETDSVWFGVTYQEDRPHVREALRKLHEAGVYAG